MAESILVTGKKISSMELVTNVTGNEKIPTGQPEDLAITPNQIADHTIARGDLASQEDLSQVEVSLVTQITDLTNDVNSADDSIRGLIAAEEAARISADNLKVDKEGSVTSVAGRVGDVVLAPSDVLVDGFGSQEDVNKYVPKPFLSGYTYGLGERVLLSNGEVVKSTIEGNVSDPNISMAGWVSAVSDSLATTVQTFNTPEAGVDPVTGVANGAYFNVRSSSDDSYVEEYQNIGGVPTPSGKSSLSTGAIPNIPHNNLRDRDAVGAHPASAILDASGKNQQEINESLTFREIYLSHLGAKFDGSDEKDIFQAAIELADNNTTIVFDKTGFTFSSVDYGDKSVSLRGVPSISAQTLAVTVYISGAGIICNTQKVKSAYIDFQSTGTKTDGNNICLLTNNRNNGVWLHIKSVRASKFSGHVLYAKDLIDTEISDFIPNNNNKVFCFYKDAWVSNTTIKLNKIYGQQNTKVFEADDCDHSLMIDCIFEYNTSLGHSNNSSWTAINLYTENNSSPLTMVDSYWLPVHHYAYTPNDRVIVTQPGLSYVDKGVVNIGQKSIFASSITKGFERLTGISPSFAGQTWTKLGRAYLGEGGSMEIEIVGAASYSQPAAPSATAPIGKTVIYAQARNSTQAGQPNIQAHIHQLGMGAGVTQCRLVQATNRFIYDVYVLQDSLAYIGFGVQMGRGDYFEQDVQRLQPKPTGGGSGDVNTPTMLIAFPYARLGAGSAYVGSDGTSPILGGQTATTVGAAGTASALPVPVGYITVNINGTNYKMPYFNV